MSRLWTKRVSAAFAHAAHWLARATAGWRRALVEAWEPTRDLQAGLFLRTVVIAATAVARQADARLTFGTVVVATATVLGRTDTGHLLRDVVVRAPTGALAAIAAQAPFGRGEAGK